MWFNTNSRIEKPSLSATEVARLWDLMAQITQERIEDARRDR